MMQTGFITIDILYGSNISRDYRKEYRQKRVAREIGDILSSIVLYDTRQYIVQYVTEDIDYFNDRIDRTSIVIAIALVNCDQCKVGEYTVQYPDIFSKLSSKNFTTYYKNGFPLYKRVS